MNKNLKILLRLHEIYELKLQSVSDGFDFSSPRQGYEHEFAENKEILELLNRFIEMME